MLPIVIVNPKSASGATREKWSGVAADLRAHFGPFRVAFTKKPGDGINLARRYAEAGTDLIIACGGDGTINEIANGILSAGSDTEMAVFPSGTGGDFRRTLGLPTNTRDIARALRIGRTRRIDVGKISYISNDGRPAERFFVNVSSFGLAASIIDRVKSHTALKWIPADNFRGRASFALSTLMEVIDLEPKKVLVSIDDESLRPISTVNFCIANARYFGGGMLIAPEAKLSDGKFDIVNIGDITTARVLLNSHTLYRGTHLNLDEVRSRTASKVTATPLNDNDLIRFEMDGELPGRLPAVFEIVPSALRIRCPDPLAV
ncbi:MAG: diacylglycerol kinase family protein [Acidobacteriota bacterium]|jgi:diacylglycerol kinase (ATP)